MSDEPVSPEEAAAREARRRERRARVFGEVLPDSTRDDRPDEAEGRDGTDEWLRRQVPPHHG